MIGGQGEESGREVKHCAACDTFYVAGQFLSKEVYESTGKRDGDRPTSTAGASIECVYGLNKEAMDGGIDLSGTLASVDFVRCGADEKLIDACLTCGKIHAGDAWIPEEHYDKDKLLGNGFEFSHGPLSRGCALKWFEKIKVSEMKRQGLLFKLKSLECSEAGERKRKIAVVGKSGSIASYVIRSLGQEGYKVSYHERGNFNKIRHSFEGGRSGDGDVVEEIIDSGAELTVLCNAKGYEPFLEDYVGRADIPIIVLGENGEMRSEEVKKFTPYFFSVAPELLKLPLRIEEILLKE